MANNTQAGIGVTSQLASSLFSVTTPQRRTLMSRIGAWIFAATDAEAGWWGWEIHERWRGLARRYRDPRFDQRARLADIDSEHRHAIGGD
jgi:hypothetical protein